RGFSPFYGCYFHRDLQQRTVHWTSQPSFRPNAAPAYRHGCDSVSLGIGAWLSPVYFRRPQPRPVSCYALLGGWLLLSLPSSCLGLGRLSISTLSQDFGALTQAWVVPLAAMDLTPTARLRPSTALMDSK